MNVLIIEDDKFTADLIAKMVRPLTDSPVISYTMEEGSRYLASAPEPPEIITVDLSMPDSDRVNTIRVKLAEIRYRAPNSIIIVLTGMVLHDETAECLKYGADAVFEKSEVATPRQLFSKLAQLVVQLNERDATPATRVGLLEAVTNCISNLTTQGI